MNLTLIAQFQGYVSAHPLAAMALSALGGAGLQHIALSWLETNALSLVDSLTKKFRERQRAAAKKLGFTDAQILEAEQKEAHATLLLAQRAAADLEAPETSTVAPSDGKA